METNQTQLVSDQLEIADTLHRYAFGLDHNDADALGSAFTEDCTFDFTPAGGKLGLRFPKLSGREAVVRSLISLLGPLDTSHTVSNLQVKISGDSATAQAYIMAQHFMPSDGPRRGTENALLMNHCELVRDGPKWRLSRVKIENAWAEGDPEILNALATHRVLVTKPKQGK